MSNSKFLKISKSLFFIVVNSTLIRSSISFERCEKSDGTFKQQPLVPRRFILPETVAKWRIIAHIPLLRFHFHHCFLHMALFSWDGLMWNPLYFWNPPDMIICGSLEWRVFSKEQFFCWSQFYIEIICDKRQSFMLVWSFSWFLIRAGSDHDWGDLDVPINRRLSGELWHDISEIENRTNSCFTDKTGIISFSVTVNSPNNSVNWRKWVIEWFSSESCYDSPLTWKRESGYYGRIKPQRGV